MNTKKLVIEFDFTKLVFKRPYPAPFSLGTASERYFRRRTRRPFLVLLHRARPPASSTRCRSASLRHLRQRRVRSAEDDRRLRVSRFDYIASLDDAYDQCVRIYIRPPPRYVLYVYSRKEQVFVVCRTFNFTSCAYAGMSPCVEITFRVSNCYLRTLKVI